MKKLDLDHLQVVSFETGPAAVPMMANFTGGEDCFTFLSGCCIPTRTRE
jgi:hypothetical protein